MSISIDLTGKVALVTGASQGIGAAIAARLHQAGATVVLNHPGIGSSASDAESIADALNAQRSGSASVVCADVSDPTVVQAMMDALNQTHGGLDVLVNNAGILRDRTISKMSLDEWNAVLEVNLSGVFHSIKFGTPVMRDGGAIVSLGSIAAFVGFFGQANYAAAKAGVLAMTRVASREFAKRGIRVNAVAPGVIATPMAATIPDSAKAEMLKQVPMGRFGEPSEVADVVLFLVSDLASYVNGQTLHVNGGWLG
jgi:3-oxoacyl-[acyl-carrier protein] reductase